MCLEPVSQNFFVSPHITFNEPQFHFMFLPIPHSNQMSILIGSSSIYVHLPTFISFYSSESNFPANVSSPRPTSFASLVIPILTYTTLLILTLKHALAPLLSPISHSSTASLVPTSNTLYSQHLSSHFNTNDISLLSSYVFNPNGINFHVNLRIHPLMVFITCLTTSIHYMATRSNDRIF